MEMEKNIKTKLTLLGIILMEGLLIAGCRNYSQGRSIK